MKDLIEFKWTRPESKEFPKIWHTFKAKDIDSDELVEYRIQDLPMSRKEEVLEYMARNFIKDEPFCCAYGRHYNKNSHICKKYLIFIDFKRIDE